MEHMKAQKKIHKKYLWTMLFRIKDILKKLDACNDIDVPA